MSGRRYNWQEIRKAYETGSSRNEIKQRFQISQGAWSSAIKAKKIVLKSEDEHFNGYNPRPLEDVLVKDSPHKDITSLKKRLLKEGILNNTCISCGIEPLWNGSPLVLHLDHTNGDNSDNRIENLRILCPNCHSQTETYCGRNK